MSAGEHSLPMSGEEMPAADAALDAAEGHAVAEGAAEGAAETAAETAADATPEASTAERAKDAVLSTEPHEDLESVEFPWNPEDGGETRLMRGTVKSLNGLDMANPFKTALADWLIGAAEVLYAVRTGGVSDGEDGEDAPDESGEIGNFETPNADT